MLNDIFQKLLHKCKKQIWLPKRDTDVMIFIYVPLYRLLGCQVSTHDT